MAGEFPLRRRLGVYGGSFDPPHRGHLFVARAARKALSLDHVLFLPAARPPHKPGRVLVAGEERVAMLRLTLAGEGGFSIDERELSRAGPSYTVDTVREILAEEGGSERVELFLIFGGDNLGGLPEWCEVEALMALVRPVVVHRGGEPGAVIDSLAGELSAATRRKLTDGLLQVPPMPASSTSLRDTLREGGDPHGWLASGVLERIVERGLYRTEE
jgi:nicotinate-nucleotide adenylyltransferase